VSPQSSLPIFARMGDREVPVRWAWFRPEPQVGDTVRLPMAPDGTNGWQSFRVVGKQVRDDAPPIGFMMVDESPMRGTIALDVEPIPVPD
jgi:hypothetical protein